MSPSVSVVLFLLAQAQAAPPELPPGVVAAEWERRPTQEEMLRVLPARAAELGQDGRAVMRCDVTKAGTLRNCAVLSEEPTGYGFGGALLALAPAYRMKPATLNGQPVDSWIDIPVRWKLERGVADADRRILPDPVWFEAPTRADVDAVRPAGRTGATVLRCEVALNIGRLKDCSAATGGEDSLSRAASKLAPKFRTLSVTREQLGKIRHLYVDVPVLFSEAEAGVDLKGAKLRAVEGEGETAAFPAAARAAGEKKGRAVLACDVGINGALAGCAVRSETPAGLGFGEAAIKTARGIAVNAWTDDGRPVDGKRVQVPLSFVDEAADGR